MPHQLMIKLSKRICAFIISAAMVLTSVTIPVNTKTVEAAEQTITGTKNDTLAGLYTTGATAITKGSTYVVTMNASGKKVDDSMQYDGYIGKGFRFTTGNGNSFYEIYGVNSSVSGDIICNIYNSSFQNIGDELGGENSIAMSNSFKTIVKLNPNSTYYIVFATENSEDLKTNSSSKGRLTVTEIADDHQDTKDKATIISPGTSYSCKSEGSGDIDFFRLTTSATKSYYTLNLSNQNITSSLAVAVYDSKNEIIYEGEAEKGVSCKETLELLPKESYYIKVTAGEDRTDVYSTESVGSYQLQVTSKADDYGDIYNDAADIEINKDYTGIIQHENDHDIVKFNTGDLNKLNFTASNSSTTEDLNYVISSTYGEIESGSIPVRGRITETLTNEMITKNMEYYIEFYGEADINYVFGIKPVSHNITYELDGGINNPNNLAYFYETESRELLPPTKTGYSFEGWYTTKNHIKTLEPDDPNYDSDNPENNIVSSKITHVGADEKNITLYANWSIQSYTVTFKDNDEIVKIQTVRHGEPAEAPELKKAGYTYKWNKEFSNITGDTEILAVWTPNIYTVKFDANGGTGTMANRTTKYDKDITLSTCKFTKEGHHFTGWKTAEVEALIADGTTTKNLTTGTEAVLYAQWEKDTFPVTFMDGTKVIETQNVPWKESAKIPSVTKPGYTASCESDLSNIIEARTVYITWIPNTYTINYNSNNGTGSMRSNIAVYEQDVTLNKNMFKRTGFDFAGWSLTRDGQILYKDEDTVHNITDTTYVTLYAQWKKHEYVVEFKDGNNTVKTEKVLFLDAATAPSLNKAGYILSWDKSFSEVRDELIVNAVWIPVSYSIIYNANGGAGTMNNDIATYDNFQKLSPCQFIRQGYDFIGWALTPSSDVIYKDNAMSINLTASKSVTLFAQWKKKTYSIEFVSDGITIGTAEVEYGNPLTPPPITKDGYSLSWDRDISSIKDGGRINAIWTLNQYTIVFNANGGKGSMPAKTVIYGQTITLPNKFKKTNYKFVGWKINNKGILFESDDEIKNLAQTGTITMYAQWKADKSKPAKVKISSIKSSQNKAVIKFKKAAKAQGYIISYSLNKKMKKAKTVKTTKTKVTIKKLTKGKTYYVTVKAYKKVAGKTIYGKKSSLKRIKIK